MRRTFFVNSRITDQYDSIRILRGVNVEHRSLKAEKVRSYASTTDKLLEHRE